MVRQPDRVVAIAVQLVEPGPVEGKGGSQKCGGLNLHRDMMLSTCTARCRRNGAKCAVVTQSLHVGVRLFARLTAKNRGAPSGPATENRYEAGTTAHGPKAAQNQMCGVKSQPPMMNSSSCVRATSSGRKKSGLFIRYAEAGITGPPMPRSLAIFAARTASMMTPAEFGESHTSSLYSRFRGTSPKARPSSRT